MTATRLWVGVDIGADVMSVCATDDQGGTVLEESIPATAAAFDDLLRARKRRIKLIAVESCSLAIPLTRSLRKLGYRVAVFDSRQTSRFLAIRQNKNDSNDARGLAAVARLGHHSVSQVRVKSAECQRLRSLLVTRRKLVHLRVMAESSLRSLFELNGGRLKSSSTAASLKRNVADEIKRVRKLSRVDLTEDVASLVALCEASRSYLEGLDKKLSGIAKENVVCRNFLEITGVGPICALSLYSAVEDPWRFKRAADIGPYLGMVPVLRQSGQTTSKRRISKRGDKLTRSYLTNAAVQHLRLGTSSVAAWGKALMQRTTKRQAYVAVGRKLAVTMIAIWKSGERYDPYHGTETRPQHLT